MNDIYRRYLLQYSTMYKDATPYRANRHYGTIAGYHLRSYDGVFNSEHAGMISGVDFHCPLLSPELSDLMRVD